MKKILIAVVASILSFVAGLGAVYVLLPTLAPGRVAAVQARQDSLAAVQAGHAPEAHTAAATPVVNTAAPGALVPETQPQTSTQGTANHAAAPAQAPAKPAAAAASGNLSPEALKDTVAALRKRLQASDLERARLKGQLTQLQQKAKAPAPAAAPAVTPAAVTELSNTLGKMEDRELKAILTQLDDGTLRQLYAVASGKVKTRILQGLSADRAARFVKGLVSPSQAAPAKPRTTRPVATRP